MAVCYNKLWKLLIDKKMSRTQLRKEAHITSNALAKLEKDEETNDNEIVVKRKRLEMKPMDEEEAILEMNLIGHEFFVYKDMHTNKVCVMYRRKDGNYGVIETY